LVFAERNEPPRYLRLSAITPRPLRILYETATPVCFGTHTGVAVSLRPGAICEIKHRQ
jgi:hypothetical protein